MLPQASRTRIANQLKHFGCNAREAAIYIQCLQLGPSSVQEIAKKLSQNRVTVHSAIEQLIHKGLLFESRKGKQRLIVAEPPEVFRRMIRKEESELKLVKSNMDEMIQLLNSAYTSDSSVPTVKFYEEVDGFKKMLEETLSAKDEVLVFTYVDLFSKLLDPDYLEDYFQRRAAKGIHTRLIFPPCPFVKRVNKRAKAYKIQIRLLPPELKWRSGIFSWNNSISVKSFTQSRLTCTIIENEDIAYFYRNIIFELIWKQAKPVS